MNNNEKVKRLERENLNLLDCIDYLNRHIQSQDHQKKMESYPYIGLNFNYFTKLLKFVRKKVITWDKPKFIDYGCGVGLTIKYARLLGFDTKGIDYNQKFQQYEIEIADLKTYEFKQDFYDVVYFYSPFKMCEYEIPFEIKAIQSVKVGGYVIAPEPSRIASVIRNPHFFGSEEEKIKELKKLAKNFKLVGKDYPIIQRIK